MEALDGALRIVGGYKRWHITMIFCVGMSSYLSLCWQQLNIIFTGWTPPHHCSVPPGSTYNESIPEKNGDADQCKIYANITNNRTVPCTHGWTFQNTVPGEETLVTQWDLVCDRGYLIALTQTLFEAGIMVGQLTCSIIVDRFGRKWTMILSHLAIAVLGSVLVAAPNMVVYMALRSITAIIITPCVLAGETILIEHCDVRMRTIAGSWQGISWGISYMLMVPIAYILRDWMHLQLFISLFNLIFMIYIWYLPESAFWLTANGKLDEAEKVLAQIAKFNGVKATGPFLSSLKDLSKNELSASLPDVQLSRSQEWITSLGTSDNSKTEQETSEKLMENGDQNDNFQIQSADPPKEIVKIRDMFCNPLLLKHLIIYIGYWIGGCLVYYVITLSTPALPGDRFVISILLGLVELPACVVCYFSIRKSRKYTVAISFMTVGVSLIIVPFIPDETASGTNLQPLQITMVIFAKFCICISWAAFLLYGKEIFPTNLRASSRGIGAMFGAMSNTIAPFLAYVAVTHPWVPNVILVVISILMGLVTFLLPETAGKALPQSIADVRGLYKTTPKKPSKLSPERNIYKCDRIADHYKGSREQISDNSNKE